MQGRRLNKFWSDLRLDRLGNKVGALRILPPRSIFLKKKIPEKREPGIGQRQSRFLMSKSGSWNAGGGANEHQGAWEWTQWTEWTHPKRLRLWMPLITAFSVPQPPNKGNLMKLVISGRKTMKNGGFYEFIWYLSLEVLGAVRTLWRCFLCSCSPACWSLAPRVFWGHGIVSDGLWFQGSPRAQQRLCDSSSGSRCPVGPNLTQLPQLSDLSDGLIWLFLTNTFMPLCKISHRSWPSQRQVLFAKLCLHWTEYSILSGCREHHPNQ